MVVSQALRAFAEHRGSDGTSPGERARFPVRQDFAFQNQLAVFGFQAFGKLRGIDFENSGDAGAIRAGADHFGGGTRTEQQRQRIDDDGFAAARFAREQIEAAMKTHADLFHYGVVLNRQLDEH